MSLDRKSLTPEVARQYPLELVLRHIARVNLYDLPRILMPGHKFMDARDPRPTGLRCDFAERHDLRKFWWPEPDTGDTTFERLGLVKVFMDDIYLCPNCAEWWPRETFSPWRNNRPDWLNWQSDKIRELALTRLDVKEFSFSKCQHAAACACRRSENIQKFSKQRMPRPNLPPQPISEPPRKPANEPVVENFVYLFRMEQFYKIGIATKPNKRLGSIQTGSPFKVELLKAWPAQSAREVEAALPKTFRTHRKSGEWFSLPEQLLAELLQVQNIEEFIRENPAA